MLGMWIVELWRYPVKSLAGERLTEADLQIGGIAGDRIYQVRRSDGRIVDARAHPKMLALHPTLTPNGDLLIDGKPWNSDEMAQIVEDAAAVGPGAHLERRQDSERFDVLPLLVATDGAVAALGYDYRRLRPNILIGGVKGLAEREWKGRLLRIGSALILKGCTRSLVSPRGTVTKQRRSGELSPSRCSPMVAACLVCFVAFVAFCSP